MKSFVIFALSLSLLAVWMLGCASAPPPMVWTKPGATQEELSKVRYKCLQEAQQETSHSTNKGLSGSAYSRSITNNSLFPACMNASGWYAMRAGTKSLEQ